MESAKHNLKDSSYLSILKYVSNNFSGENIAIGMFAISGDQAFFKLSRRKLEVVKKLNAHTIPLIDFSVSQFIKLFEKDLEKTSQQKLLNTRILTVDYLNRLAVYNNGILQFSDPQSFNMMFDNSVFDGFFKKFVDDSVSILSVPRKMKFQIFRKKYFSKVAERFNIQQKLTSKEIPNLLLPVKFDLVGKNDHEVVAEFVNIENPVHIITQQVNNFYSFKDAIPNSIRYLVTSEPDKFNYPEQHNLWTNLRNQTKLAKHLDVQDADEIHEYAIKHGVAPLIV